MKLLVLLIFIYDKFVLEIVIPQNIAYDTIARTAMNLYCILCIATLQRSYRQATDDMEHSNRKVISLKICEGYCVYRVHNNVSNQSSGNEKL